MHDRSNAFVFPKGYRSSAALHGESHGSLRLLAVGDEDGLVKLHRRDLYSLAVG